jgi:succinate-acetate transporter protein
MAADARGSHQGLAAGDGQAPQDITRIMLRPLASSLPMGFFAFCAGTVLLTALELKWVPAAQTRQLMTMALVFVVPLEALAGILAFLARDVGAATGLSVLSVAWAATSATVRSAPPGSLSPALGILLLTLAAMMIVLSAGAIQSKPLFGVLLLIGAARFAVTGVYQLYGGAALATAAGWIGVPLAAFALYGGLALLLEDAQQRTVLPLGRRGRARTSLEGGLEHQLSQAEREAGVRRQL